jgi:hypothetical protein
VDTAWRCIFAAAILVGVFGFAVGRIIVLTERLTTRRLRDIALERGSLAAISSAPTTCPFARVSL